MEGSNLDLSFHVPEFGLSGDSKKSPYDLIKEYDKKVEGLTKELLEARFDRDRYRTALELLSVYINDLK